MYHHNLSRWFKFSIRHSKFLFIVIGLATSLACAGEDEIATSGSGFDEFGPTNQRSPNQSAVGALFSTTGYTGCSVAFLSPEFVITAARCVYSQPTGPYFVVVDSPATSSSSGLAVASLVVHPLWNSTELNRASEHVSAVRQGQSGYYQSNASYDLAILELSTPKVDGVIFEPNRSEAALQSIETLFFANAPTGTSRSGGQLTVAMTSASTLTVTQYSQKLSLFIAQSKVGFGLGLGLGLGLGFGFNGLPPTTTR